MDVEDVRHREARVVIPYVICIFEASPMHCGGDCGSNFNVNLGISRYIIWWNGQRISRPALMPSLSRTFYGIVHIFLIAYVNNSGKGRKEKNKKKRKEKRKEKRRGKKRGGGGTQKETSASRRV